MSRLLFLMDVPLPTPSPDGLVPWGALVLLLVVILILAVAFAAGLVFLLIWLKRRKMKDDEESKPAEQVKVQEFLNPRSG